IANKLLWSVSATAGIPAADTAAINSGTRTIPSTREYPVCRRKWTNLLKGPPRASAAAARRSADAEDRAREVRGAADERACHIPCELRRNTRDIAYPYDSYNYPWPS